CRGAGIPVDPSAMPEGTRRLYHLATAVPPAERTASAPRAGMIEQLGRSAMDFVKGAREMTRFVGEATLSFGRFLSGRARFKRADLWLTIQQCGADALPIVSLISFLVGVILAFVGFSQLRQFGAEIFVADLVGIAMARDIGPIMAAIVMAGRTGAAFSAQLGTMQVNEEIDALRTFGMPPIDFLVLPRMLALMLMLPLLALYANLLGILGGAVVGVLEPTITLRQYWQETLGSIALLDFAGGLIKSVVYGALVALAGCMRGMACGRSAAAVGNATTSAVVTGIVSVVVACATLTVVYDIIGI
ncbi:ABC transporter permease, partial [Limibaculum sp. FT325]|uniref:MlaE family ABC transporter permease n=1 Tax=Thermohalobaculum sediminis TaxID=2939436 RepID=UPI0020BE23B1